MNVENSLAREIAGLKKQRDAVVLAHFYTPGDVQDVKFYNSFTIIRGGFLGWSLLCL